ncbi:MAG: EamA family transporter [Pseudomonadota bacterium]
MSLNHVLLAVLVAFLWGFNFVVMKLGLTEMPQFLFSGLRFLFVAFPLVLFIPKPKTSWPILIGIGFSQGFLSFACMFKGMTLGTPAGLSSIILQMHIPFALVLSYFVLNIKPTNQQIAGVSIAVIGMYLIVLSLNYHFISISAFLMVVLAASFWATANLLLKLAGPVDSFALVIWSCLFSPIPNFICSYYIEGPDAIIASFSGLSLYGFGALFYTIVFATWIGATLQTYLIKHYSPIVVAPYSLLIPIVGMASGWIFLGETMSLKTILACGIVFIGLVVNQLPIRKKYTISLGANKERKAA